MEELIFLHRHQAVGVIVGSQSFIKLVFSLALSCVCHVGARNRLQCTVPTLHVLLAQCPDVCTAGPGEMHSIICTTLIQPRVTHIVLSAKRQDLRRWHCQKALARPAAYSHAGNRAHGCTPAPSDALLTAGQSLPRRRRCCASPAAARASPGRRCPGRRLPRGSRRSAALQPPGRGALRGGRASAQQCNVFRAAEGFRAPWQ